MKGFAKTRLCVLATMAVVFYGAIALAQDATGQQQGAPPAATGPGAGNPQNPPITGLDKPVSEPVFGGRSYLVPGAQLSQAADGYTSGGDTYAITRFLGSLDMEKTWKTSQFGLDYIGGGAVYEGTSVSGTNAYQMHTLSADERLLWHTGQLAIRDSFNYLPEGIFGFASYGGAGAFDASGGISGLGPGSGVGSGIAGNSPTGSLGGIDYGSFGLQSRIDNLADIDITQAFSPRTSVTLSGGYAIGHYLDKSSSPFPLFDSQQLTAQAGYNYQLNARDQIGVSYAFGQFHFPQSNGIGSIKSQTWSLLYGHRISGRLNLVIGGGPELITIHTPEFTIPVQGFPGVFLQFPARTTSSISGSGTATLDYTVSARSAISLNYLRAVSGGSGYFPGAKSDVVSGSLSHLFARRWTTTTSVGYSRSSNLQSGTPLGGVNATSYNYWFAGTSIRRQIGRHFNAFISYQYDSFAFASCTTAGGLSCGQQARQHNGVIGIEWHPDPLRLD